MNIRLHIDRLVLEGIALAPWQQPQLQAALEGELARLLAVGGLAPDIAQRSAQMPLTAGQIRLAHDQSPTHLGQQVARAVYGGIGS